jgi:peptide/nickel transport system ATP-binding protein
MTAPLLSIRGLCVDYVTPSGRVRAVDRVSLEVGRGEVLGVAGESGCGKSTLALALLRILPPPAVITGGEALFEGRDLLRLSEPELREVRWRRISMVFQSAMDALNPVLTVGEQLEDTLRTHRAAPRGGTRSSRPEPADRERAVSSREARERAAALLELVGIAPDRLRSFPHQLSGGMRQRIGIAIALALEPSLVILDEPTTALDVIVEREILSQLLELRRKLGFSVLFITHDLARMLEISDRIAVFYAARLIEVAPAAALRADARHPYTRGLLRAFPALRGDTVPEVIPGAPPSLRTPPPGCRFNPRCVVAVPQCREVEPVLETAGPGHAVACRVR